MQRVRINYNLFDFSRMGGRPAPDEDLGCDQRWLGLNPCPKVLP